MVATVHYSSSSSACWSFSFSAADGGVSTFGKSVLDCGAGGSAGAAAGNGGDCGTGVATGGGAMLGRCRLEHWFVDGGLGVGGSSFLGHAAKDDLVQLLANALEPVEGVHLPRQHSRPVCRPSADRLSRKSFSMPTANTRTDSTRHVVRICRSVQVWAFAVGMHMFVWGEGPDLHSGIGTLWRGALVKSFISS